MLVRDVFLGCGRNNAAWLWSGVKLKEAQAGLKLGINYSSQTLRAVSKPRTMRVQPPKMIRDLTTIESPGGERDALA